MASKNYDQGGSIKIPLGHIESIDLFEPGQQFSVSINFHRDKDGNRQCIHVIHTDNVIHINGDHLLIEC